MIPEGMKVFEHPRRQEILDAVRTLIRCCGEDPDDEGLRDTPDRVHRSILEMTAGRGHTPENLFKQFTVEYGGMVVVRKIDFVSLCEHHLMPFSGYACVGYVPNGKVVGLSKLARLVDLYAKRLQIQERMTEQITNAMEQHLKPFGCGCIVEAQHGCMSCRGVKKAEALMVTESLRGSFKTDALARSEFIAACRG